MVRHQFWLVSQLAQVAVVALLSVLLPAKMVHLAVVVTMAL